ncbi:MAG: HAMP domain-containing histidine kinase [Bacteroidetes bacterium]|nr:HAMP domain-containing histidine kinase [Bacteroidota bacterium]
MISVYKKRKLSFITAVYWILLLFIIAAWIWWFISLQRQSNLMRLYQTVQLNKDDPAYEQHLNHLNNEHIRRTTQYISEGITFIIVTLIGAVFVYRSVRKQFFLTRQQQNFMMAVTHELKTPIAIVSLNLETLQKRKLDEEKQQRLISTTLKESERLNDLTTNILVASQLESNYTPDKEHINLSALAEKCITDFSNRYPERKITKSIEADIEINGDKLLLQLLINNLLDNAAKYSPKEKNISIALAQQAGKIILKFADEGIGIEDREKKKIFDIFYRSGNETIRKTKGTGLGLYLCKRIAENHRAKIKVTDNQSAGSIFIIEFTT